MANQAADLDRLFHAMSDTTRRGMVERLIRSPASVGELAGPLNMSLPSVMQHLQVLQDCGLVSTQKIGRVRTCSIEPAGLRVAEGWLTEQRTLWERHLDRLGEFLAPPGAAEDSTTQSTKGKSS